MEKLKISALLILVSLTFLTNAQPGIKILPKHICYQFTKGLDTIDTRKFDFISCRLEKNGKLIGIEMYENKIKVVLGFSPFEHGDVVFHLGLNGDTMKLRTGLFDYVYPFKKGEYDFAKISEGFNTKLKIKNLPDTLFKSGAIIPIKTEILYVTPYKKRELTIIDQDLYGEDSVTIFRRFNDTITIENINKFDFKSKTFCPYNEIDSLSAEKYYFEKATVLFKDTVYLQYTDRFSYKKVLFESNNLNSGKWTRRIGHIIAPNSWISSCLDTSYKSEPISKTKNGYQFIFEKQHFYYSKDGKNWILKHTGYSHNRCMNVRNPILWLGENKYSIISDSGTLIIMELEEDL